MLARLTTLLAWARSLLTVAPVTDRYRATVEHAPVAVSHHAPDGRWLMANQRFCDLLGFSRDELFALTSADLMHPDDRDSSRTQIQRLLHGDITEFEQEIRYRRKDGSFLWTEAHLALVRDAAGAPDYFIVVVQDIGARKAAEISLNATEQRFRLLFERSLDAMAVTDDQGQYLLVNAAACDLLGYSREELLAMRVTDLRSSGPTPTPTQFKAYLADPAQRGTFRFLRPDGTERIARHASVEIAPGEHLAILHDITERVQQAAQLRESERTLRIVLDTLPVGVCFSDANGRIVYGNPAIRRIWAGDLMVGIEEYDQYKGWWPDTGRRIAAEEWGMARALRGEPCHDELVDIEAFDGERKRISNTALALRDEDGRIRGAMAVMEDISIRHRAETEVATTQARLAAVINTAPDAIINVDRRGRIESFNPAAEHLFGYARQDVVGEPVSRLMTFPQGQGRQADPVEGLARLARSRTVLETTARRSDGGVFPVELSVGAMSPLDSYTCIVRDVTERVAAQAAVRETERMAAVGGLAAGLAHDMANLVAPIRMGAALLERLELDEQVRASVAIINRCAASLIDLTDSVRLLVRGEPAAAPRAVDLCAWWDLARPMLQAALPPGVVLSGDFQLPLPPIRANEGQLSRAILNLVTNAGEAIAGIGDRGGHVVVWARLADHDEDVLIGVRDDGPGIPPDALERLFKPFYSTKPWSRSSGLGLTSVKAFATDAGGSVSIDTTIGRGTDVVLRLRTCEPAAP